MKQRDSAYRARISGDGLTLDLGTATLHRELLEALGPLGTFGENDLADFPMQPGLRVIVDCEPEMPMGDILPILRSWTDQGVGLSFTASTAQKQ